MTDGGSTWRIWDLHVHTPCSWLNNQYGDPTVNETWDIYAGRLEAACAQRGIAAIGVTDYFSIDGYKRLKHLQEHEERLKGIFLFPNIEFRLNTMVHPHAKSEFDLGEAKRINLHVLLDPSLSTEEIEEDFLHQLKFVDQEHAFETGETKILNERNLRTFGEHLIEQNKPLKARSPLHVACSMAVVSEDQIKEALFVSQTRFKGHALIVLAEENTSDLAWFGAGHAVRRKLIQMSHAIFASSESSRDFYLGKKHASTEAFVEEFASIKPCYWGSDAHSFDEPFLEPADTRYLWLKCTPCWEGLRQTLFEPEERVSIGPSCPKGAQSSYAVDRLVIDCPSESTLPVRLEPQTIPLNKGLVAIIGGRGSGKTALLDLLASAYSTGRKQVKLSKASFLYRVFTPDATASTISNIGLTYRFVNGDEFETSLGSGDWKIFEGAEVTYLQQNHFDSITSDPGQMKDQILKLVFDRFPEEKFAYDQLRQKTALACQAVRGFNAAIDSAFLELAPSIQLATDQGLCAGRIADLEHQLQVSESESSPTTDQPIDRAVQRKVQVVQARASCESILLRLTEADATAKAATEKLASFDWDRVNLDLNDLAAESGDLKQLPVTPAVEAMTSLTQEVDSDVKFLDLLRAHLDEELVELGKTTESLDRHQKEIERIKLELQGARNKLKEYDMQIGHMTEVKEKMNDLNSRLIVSYLSIVRAHADEQRCLTQLLTNLMALPDTEFADLTFSAELTADTPGLVENVLSIINKNLVDGSGVNSKVAAMTAAGIDWAMHLDDSSRKETLERSIGEAFASCGEKFKKNVTHQAFADTLLADCFRVNVQTCFQGVRVERLSMGQRAVVLLKLVLASSDGLLLLDQPEADLDNTYLYSELVPAIRRAKKRRQIVMATHNANLVLSGDAEEVVIAHCDNCVIHYDVASLESLDKRDEITQLLEGGREAFELRELKYGLRF